MDEGRQVAFDVTDYADLDHGYAATIHKAQGVMVDRAYVLASSGLDRHAAYVALTRHRDAVALHYGSDQFRDSSELARTLGRERAAASDERRHLEAMMAGVRSYAAGRAEVERTIRQGLPVPDRQQEAMVTARGALARLSPEAAEELRSALSRNPGLAERAAALTGTGEVMRAMQQEAEVRRSPELRAGRFVDDRRKLDTSERGCSGSATARRARPWRRGWGGSHSS